MVGEADEVEMHVFYTVLFQNTLVLNELRQIQIIQSTMLASKLQVIQRRHTVWVPLVIMHTVVLDDILHHSDASLVGAHVQRLLVGCHQCIHGRGDTWDLSASLGRASSHVTVLIDHLQLLFDLIADAGLFLGMARLRLVPRQLVDFGGWVLLLEPDAVGVTAERVVLTALALRPIARII